MFIILAVLTYHVTALSLLFTMTPPPPPQNGDTAKQGSYLIYLYAIPSSTGFFVVAITTTFLVIRLRRTLRWRQRTTSQSEKTSDRENRLVRTLLIINSIFICCYFPDVASFTTMAIDSRLNAYDPYLGNPAYIAMIFSGLCQSVSSSVNIIFCYHKMSSKFKSVFLQLFCLKSRKSVRKD